MIMSISSYKKISVEDLDYDLLNSLVDDGHENGCSLLADSRRICRNKSFCVILKEEATFGAAFGILERVETEKLEEACLGYNRFVVGQGYEIMEVLFPREFSTISVNIQHPQKGVLQTIKCMIRKAGLNRCVQSIEIIKQDEVIKLIAKFISKKAANLAYSKLSRWSLSKKNVTIFPKLEPGKEAANGLRVSWAAGKQTVVVAKISYSSFQEATKYIQSLKQIFPQGSILYHSDINNCIKKKCECKCVICFSPWEDKFIVLNCDHIICPECIDHFLAQQPPPFPVKCPECEIPMALDDVLEGASQRSLEKILEVAISRYVLNHSDEVVRCPSPGCEQLLACSSKTTGEAGGEFIFCSVCSTTYCVICSANLSRPVKSHGNYSCENENGVAVKVHKYVRDIQKILNLNCPRCKTPFIDFDACPAVTCGSCDCFFCGLCLEDCGTSKDAHSHIKRCPKNFLRKRYFVDTLTLDLIHRELRVQRILEYFLHARNLNKDTYQDALSALRNDLTALGISADWFIPSDDISDNEDDSSDCQCAKIIKLDKKRSIHCQLERELNDMSRVLERQTKIIEGHLKEHRQKLRRQKKLKRCSIL